MDTLNFGYSKTDSGIVIKKYCGTNSVVKVPEEIEQLPVTLIAGGVFAHKEDIEEIFFPKHVKHLEYRICKWCKRLTTIHFPEDLTHIDDEAFGGCVRLQNIKLPMSLIKIGSVAFAGCGSLKEILLPDSVEEIYSYAFSCCHQLQTVKLSASLRILEENVFNECDALKNIYVPKNLLDSSKKFSVTLRKIFVALPKDCRIFYI